ncbi:MAG: hypothetical protein HC820_04805 [Hydrococcus sp. RM1_1_31]|nr:hypothetical protein [Hydrococcus sp. RM1_1_31]
MEQLQCQDNFSKEGLELIWHSRLLKDYPDLNGEKRQSIIRWLLGENLDGFDELTPRQLAIAQQMMDYRYRILQQRYLEVEPLQAYGNLINRLGLLVMLCPKIRSWVSLGQKRQKIVANLIRETVEQILKGDRYLQQQMTWIQQFTQDSGLRNALLLSSLEEYCSQSICHKPLLARRIMELLH